MEYHRKTMTHQDWVGHCLEAISRWARPVAQKRAPGFFEGICFMEKPMNTDSGHLRTLQIITYLLSGNMWQLIFQLSQNGRNFLEGHMIKLLKYPTSNFPSSHFLLYRSGFLHISPVSSPVSRTAGFFGSTPCRSPGHRPEISWALRSWIWEIPSGYLRELVGKAR